MANSSRATHRSLLVAMFTQLLSYAALSAMEGIPLKNAASAGVTMPLAGLGTGGYGNGVVQPLGVYPECWTDGKPDASGSVPHPGIDCSAQVINATLAWLQVGGRRIDNGDSYEDMQAVGKAMKASGIARSDLFLTTKIGDGGIGMGEADTDTQIDYYLSQTKATYIDLLLIHWPTSSKNSSEPKCQTKSKIYDAKECRLITWRTLVKAWKAGKVMLVLLLVLLLVLMLVLVAMLVLPVLTLSLPLLSRPKRSVFRTSTSTSCRS